jgi:beta-hydroxyacyl-ACP dehydratase FabZ
MMHIEEILKILPHRHPFVLIDRILEVKEGTGVGKVGRKIKAIKNVSFNEPFFAGHFPHRPVMPGVLIIEAMAQAGAIACFSAKEPLADVAIGRIGEVRIRRPVVPGDQLLIEGEVIKDRGSMIVLGLRATVDGQLVTETELLAHVTPRSPG